MSGAVVERLIDEEPRAYELPAVPAVPASRVKLAAPLLGSSMKAAVVEIAAGLVEESAQVIAAAARGDLDLPATLHKLIAAAELATTCLTGLQRQAEGDL